MNYLDMVNSVLRRVREDTVTSLYENEFSSVVAEFVNDAKRSVEDSHDWSALRQDLTFATASGISEYSLTGSSNRATVLDVRDTTNSCMLAPVSSTYIRRQDIVSSPGTTRPSYWALQGVDSSGDTKVQLWPTPDGAYIIKAFCVLRTADLAAEGDTVSIPSKPIILLATAMAAQERGAVDSMDIQFMYEFAKQSLSDAIMYDAAKNPDEMVWSPV